MGIDREQRNSCGDGAECFISLKTADYLRYFVNDGGFLFMNRTGNKTENVFIYSQSMHGRHL